MREILFRGKSRDTNKWVFGDFVTDACGILHKEYFYGHGDIGDIMTYVIPETIGQYTGLTDKNGKKIFEGDILKGMSSLLEVYFDTQYACFDWKIISGNFIESFSGFADEYEIIGNIHDNPELLGGVTND